MKDETRALVRPRGVEDHELIRDASLGDKRAFAAIYQRYKDDLFSVAFHLLGERSAAEDVLQDVFVTLARNVRRLAGTRDLGRYLVACALNRARDVYRRQKLEPERLPGLDSESSPLPGPSARAEEEDTAQHVTAALRRLPREQRDVIVLRTWGHLTFRAVAEVTGISINTAQSRYRYGIAALKKRLAARELPV